MIRDIINKDVHSNFAEELKSAFKGDIIGREIIFYESTTSTNDRVLEIGEKGESPEGIVVIADTQSRGKGRLGRSWLSPPGVNLYFTVLLKPSSSPNEAAVLTFMAGIAVVSAIREYLGLKAVIKWPNDVLINGKKVGGILMEMRAVMEKINFIALGIGVNVNMSLETLDNDIKVIATSLKQEGGMHIDRFELLWKILSKLDYWYKIFLNGNKRVLIDEWLRLDSTIGQKVRIKTSALNKGERQQIGDGVISGIAEAVDEHGRLIVRLESGGLEKVTAGDVTIVKN